MAITLPNSIPSSSSSSVLSRAEPPKLFRPAREFTYKIRQSTSIYIEDRQFLEGFTLLNSLLVAGESTPNSPAAYVPPTSYFNLAATLIVHPQYTIRAKSEDDLRASDEALRYLRDALCIVGPVNAKLALAFTFRNDVSLKRRRKGRQSEDESNGDDDDEDEDQLTSSFAGEKSVFAQRRGFWQVVGWAFNCSVKYKKRWERWKLWLEVMIEVLEEDWMERQRGVMEEAGDMDVDLSGKLAKESLITQYLGGAGSRNGKREILRAILANGEEKSVNEFCEVWKDETKERKVREEVDIDRRKSINLDDDEWGDYDINEDEDEVMQDDEEPTEVESDGEELGGIDSIKLRQRLMVLLAGVALAIPQHFTDCEELFDIYTEFLRPLPLPVFSQLMATSAFPPEWQVALLTNTLIPLLPTTPRHPKIFEMTQARFIKDFAPSPANANSVPENAKMSLLIEHLLLNMWSCGRLKGSLALNKAVEKGIQGREAKAIGDARKKEKARNLWERSAKAVLDMSAERIRMTLAILEMEAGIASRSQEEGAAKGSLGVVDFSSSQLSDLDVDEDEDEDGDVTIVE